MHAGIINKKVFPDELEDVKKELRHQEEMKSIGEQENLPDESTEIKR
jgi:hypothetical protein